MIPTVREAAAARGSHLRAPADRPSQRRCAEEPDSGARVSARMGGVLLRESGDGGSVAFEGFASVTGRGYPMWDMFGPYDEIVAVGAFGDTLGQEGLDVPLVLQHADLRRIARTTNGTLTLDEVLTGDTTGLRVNAPALDMADQDVAYIVPKLRSGLIDEMSFKFRIVDGRWSPDWTTYTITKVDIHRGDVAIVGFGANPFTAGAGLRSPADDLDALLATIDGELAARALATLTARTAPVPTARAVVITDDDVALRH